MDDAVQPPTIRMAKAGTRTDVITPTEAGTGESPSEALYLERRGRKRTWHGQQDRENNPEELLSGKIVV